MPEQSDPQRTGRPSASKLGRLDLGLLALVLCAALALRLVDLGGSGALEGEELTWQASQRLASDLRAGRFAPERWSVAGRPLLPQLLYAPAALLGGDLQAARSVAALLGALLCGVAFLVGREFFGRGVGLAAALFCLTAPPLIASSRSVSAEAPAALFYALAIWWFWRALQRGGNARAYLVAGACAGLACAAQLASLTLVAVLAGLFLAASWSQLRRERSLQLPLNLLCAPLLALAVLSVLWPALWAGPLQQLNVLPGQLAPAVSVTAWSAALALLLTSPLPLLLGATLFLPQPLYQRDLSRLAVLLWLGAPLTQGLFPDATGGLSRLAPALVALSLAAAAGLASLSRLLCRVARCQPHQTKLFAFLCAGAAIVSLQGGLSLHPYYGSYANALIGGLSRLAPQAGLLIGGRGEGLDAASRYLNRYAPPEAAVWVAADPAHLVRLRDDLRRTGRDGAELIIYNRRFGRPPDTSGFRPVHVVRAGDAPLVWIYRRQPSIQESSRHGAFP